MGSEKLSQNDEIVEVVDLETGIPEKRSVRDHA